MIIAVIGGEAAPPETMLKAEAVGRELAQRGCDLICGGRGGVMEAACRGAKSAGGRTIGVLPGSDRSNLNPYVDLPIVTGVGAARNLTVVLSADAVIAIDGAYGTLSEIAHALQHGRPVVGVATWSLAAAGVADVPIVRTEDPLEAVTLAIAAGEAAQDKERVT